MLKLTSQRKHYDSKQISSIPPVSLKMGPPVLNQVHTGSEWNSSNRTKVNGCDLSHDMISQSFSALLGLLCVLSELQEVY